MMMIMNVQFFCVVLVGFGAAVKPSLKAIVCDDQWEMVKKEVILTTGGEITTVELYVKKVLDEVDLEKSADAYDSFVSGYRKRAQKYTALICAYAYGIMVKAQSVQEIQKAQYALDVVRALLVKFDSRLQLLSKNDYDQDNEFKWSWKELERILAGTQGIPNDVLDFVLKLKNDFHQIVADQCVPNGPHLLDETFVETIVEQPSNDSAPNELGTTIIESEQNLPIPKHRLRKRVERVKEKIRKFRTRVINKTNDVFNSNKGKNTTSTDYSKSTKGVETVDSYGSSDTPREHSNGGTAIIIEASRQDFPSSNTAVGTDKSGGNRCNLRDMYGLVAKKDVYDIFERNSQKSFSDLAWILKLLHEAHLNEDNKYNDVLTILD